MSANDLRRAFTLANGFKEGDVPLGGTSDDRLRADARQTLLAATVRDIRRLTFVEDRVSESLARSRSTAFDDELDGLSMAAIRDALTGSNVARWAHRYRDALSSEVIAAVAKVMTDDDLAATASAIFNPLAGPAEGGPPEGGPYENAVAIGSRSHFGSRIQPNSPGDDEEEILFSILEGLSYGCGDVIIGLNPASDDVDSIVRLERLLETVVRRLELPTRFCVLSDIVKQDAARARTPVDVAFQSLAGTSRAIGGMIAMDIDGLAELAASFDALYFETGQGSEVTNGAAEGVDMVTLEARTYGVARYLATAGSRRTRPTWTIVNDVAGFIGPEVFKTPAQLERACLEDVVMAKLHGLTMGLDVCATFHMGIPPAALRQVTSRIVRRAAPAYLMAVAGNADPMLGYLTTSFRQHPRLRAETGRRITSAMAQRLARLADSVPGLYAAYAAAGGDRRTATELMTDAQERLQRLRNRGLDLGGDGDAEPRVERLYAHARAALFARLDDGVLRDACSRVVRVRTAARDRDDYLSHPPAGEVISSDDARTLAALYPARRPQVQLVISDGLNANAVNEQLRAVLPPLRRLLSERDIHVGEADVVVANGRVRAGYEIGGLVDAEVVAHFIGERPGTGLNTLSAYLTFGRDAAGRPRWSRQMDHAATTAVCGIHPQGRPPEAAAAEIARAVARILEEKRSGVALATSLRAGAPLP